MDAKLFRTVVVCLAVVGLCVPQLALAATPKPVTTNVQLATGGVMLGQVVTPEHAAVAGATVSLTADGKQLATGKTDCNGHFAFNGLHQGAYRVAAANGHRDVRVWSPGVAPPAVQSGVLVVAGGDTVRAQDGGGLMGFVTSPLGLGLIVATAVAVPVAIHNSKSPSSP
ncbi:MAG: carboxypeptidase regulatory-like domain-containing protein [Pirellulales bacterium]|nr:carboxypeptidase regulatory-like domain-containing protein [Pirellulales bacterium]